ncbi:ATP-binding protein [Salinivibrio proteolyticus]|uniref:sensor histidine kinase n=1 Tax=Salinivibrio proteolyticus TaxID=334715 RepID=UPI0009889F91|nr:ATP-binding protein [Salinivibrio proteolyticus]OOF25235.1 ATP-binding protein [Salinivibrio proteolyticus]
MSKSHKFDESIRNPFFSLVGRRILLIMILLSGFFTVFTTLLQTYWDYDQAFDNVESRHYEIENIHADLLASSLWIYDLSSVQERLDGLVNLPHVNYLSVRSENYLFEAGSPVEVSKLVNEYPLEYDDPDTGRTQRIGTIYVESDTNTIYAHLIQQFFLTLLLNAIKTLLVCYLILLVFHHTVSQRVFHVAQFLRGYNPLDPGQKQLKLPRKKYIMEKEDELDWLAAETNKITDNMSTLYRNIMLERERLSDFTHVSSDWLWETDADLKLTFCSDPMRHALGIDAKHFPYLHDVLTTIGCNQFIGNLQRQQDFAMCEEIIQMDNDTRYFVFQALAHYGVDGFRGFRGTGIDITELKKTQFELEALNQNLEVTVDERTRELQESMERLKAAQDQLVESEKLAALGSLVAGVAHEVNTPLGIAVTASSVVKEITTTLNDAFKEKTLTSTQFASLMKQVDDSISMLEHNLNRASHLIRDFKQTAVDQVSEAHTEFDVKKTLDALIASLHPETRKIPVAPMVKGEEKIIMHSLPGVLTQVISNLVMNSINHAFDDTDTPQILIEFERQDEHLYLCYQDNGCGVPEELHQRIFEPFYTSKRGRGGSGLGLNLVFNLVKQKLQGELQFESTPGEGAKFMFLIPLNLANITPPHASESDQQTIGKQ